GPDGALSASRASYIGGCAGTSNVLAGKQYNIPVRGTHAHSWVTAFPDELSAFMAYADVMPHNCILLVDTYDTIQGIKNAIKVGNVLREKGGDLQGVRLDSGDMVTLSRQARQLLDEAGFQHTKIIASNSLDEYVIGEMKREKADISVWGVGTNLVTSYDHPALDGVYKLSALQNAYGVWEYKLKLSEQAAKISNPGIYQVKRFLKNGLPVMDIMYDTSLGISSPTEMVSLDVPHAVIPVTDFDASVDLLVPVFSQGKCVYASPSIHAMRTYCLQQVDQFVQAFPSAIYPLGLDKMLHDLKSKLIIQYKKL
ncbi:MAG: nicotinate phosphoribosyltransferase, partial [Gammaproteobacteria bacterium]|nr:nicotinate phosphoribosyltransferase [Gammaproteobacteria bacterium]